MIHLNITTKQLHVKVPITGFLGFLVLRSYKILKINYRRKKQITMNHPTYARFQNPECTSMYS